MRHKRLLLMRARKAAGCTQEELAYRLGVDRSTVGRWEAGETEPQPWLRPKLEKILRVTRAELSALLVVDGEASSQAAEIPNDLDLDEQYHLAVVATDARRALSPGCAAVANPGGAHIVTSSTALDMVSVSTSYRRAYRSVPASALLAATNAHLSLMLSLGPATQPPDAGHLLVRAIGEAAALEAVLLGIDLGRGSEAERFLALAQDAAKENDDSDLAAVVLACRAFLTSLNNGSLTVAAEFADAAVHVAASGPTSATTRAWVAAVSSEHFATLGDERRSLRRLDEARAALSEPANDPDWTGFGTFDLVKVTAYEGGDLMRLGRHTEAIALLDEALAGFDASMPRHRCTALIDRAEAHLAVQDIDACCGDATEALKIATKTEHHVSARRVHRLAMTVRPSNAAAALRLWTDVLGAGVGQERFQQFTEEERV